MNDADVDYLKRIAFLGSLEPEDMLHELLAVIHRDGGQHTDLVGFAVSVADAERKVLESRA